MDPDPGGPKTWVTGSNTVTTVTVSLSYAGISRRKSWARFPRSGPAPQRSFSRTSGQYLSIWSIVNPDSRDRIVNSILIERKTLILPFCVYVTVYLGIMMRKYRKVFRKSFEWQWVHWSATLYLSLFIVIISDRFLMTALHLLTGCPTTPETWAHQVFRTERRRGKNSN